MTDSVSGLPLSSGSTPNHPSHTGLTPPGDSSAEFRSNFQQLFGNRADSRNPRNAGFLDPHGRSAITPDPRGHHDYSSHGRRGRQPSAQTHRTRVPSPAQDRPRHTDRLPPARPSRTLFGAFLGSKRPFLHGLVLVWSVRRAADSAAVSATSRRAIADAARASPHSRSRSRHSNRHRPARSATSSTSRVVCHRAANQYAGDLAREFRMDLMDKHAFRGFTRTDFDWAARNFWPNGYQSVDDVRGMDTRERGMFLSHFKSGHGRSRNRLSDVRLIFRIFAWFGPLGKLRDPARGG